MHEHTFIIVVEWKWFAQVLGKRTFLNGLKNTTGMTASKLMCPCGEIKEV